MKLPSVVVKAMKRAGKCRISALPFAKRVSLSITLSVVQWTITTLSVATRTVFCNPVIWIEPFKKLSPIPCLGIDPPTGCPHCNLLCVSVRRGRRWRRTVYEIEPDRHTQVRQGCPLALGSSTNSKDIRTNHQVLPVISGVKYGFNAWIHQRDFRGPQRKGCHYWLV